MRFAPPCGLPFTIVTVPTTLLAAEPALVEVDAAGFAPAEEDAEVEPPDEPQPPRANAANATRDSRAGVRRTQTSGSSTVSKSLPLFRWFLGAQRPGYRSVRLDRVAPAAG